MSWDEFVKDFLLESSEILTRLDQDFVELEKNPEDRERLSSIYRGVHTIKGNSGLFAFANLEAVAHAGENLLTDLEGGRVVVTEQVTTSLLAMVDAVREMMGNIESTGRDGDGDYSDLVTTLEGLRAPVKKRPAIPVVDQPPPAPTMPQPAEESEPPPPPPPEEPRVQAPPPVEAGVVEGADATPAEPTSYDRPASSIRVSVDLLDKLVTLVGELVLSRNQVLQYTGTVQDRVFLSACQQLDHITTELQETVMKTRMQPIRNLFSKFPRVVRDLAVTCEKKVRLQLEGEDTELDKNLLEAINAPLTHIIRNCVDHGIEKPEVRSRCGKPEAGRVRLSAFHESGRVNIEISDDGGGIDAERIRQKALEAGVATAQQLQRMSEPEILNLVFVSGLSTAKTVSHISGRGVGMDVVRANIERIGGTVDFHSRAGEGTTLKIRIPLTLAIIPALIVTSGADSYAIPQVSLVEAVRLTGENLTKGITCIHDTPVLRLRGRLLPLVNLAEELGVAGREGEKSRLSDSESVEIVVVQADDHQFGLVVDEICDTLEIVVKPISKLLRGGKTCFAGATIMDDGQPALILDVLGVALRARVLSDALEKPLFEARAEPEQQRRNLETLLVFEAPNRGRMAMKVSSVGRLETFDSASVESAGTQQVVQYGEQILPLVRVFSDLLHQPEADVHDPDEPLSVVVYHRNGSSVGLIVGKILDIVEEEISVRGGTTRDGIAGTVVVQGRVTELVDIDELLDRSGCFVPSTMA